MKNKQLAMILIVASMTTTQIATAQNITARSTTMNWSSLYGGGPTIINPSDSFLSSTMETNVSHNLGFSDNQSGDFPIGWTAFVNIDINQGFSISGPTNNFTSITASMDGMMSKGTTGIGAAGIDSILPGNELIFSFNVANTMNYSLAGSLYYDLNGAFENSKVSIQTFNGFFWSDILGATTTQLGNNQNFNFTGTLATGDYRLYANNTVPGGFPTFQSNNNYTFTNLDAVPEPGTMLVLGAAALLARRKRK